MLVRFVAKAKAAEAKPSDEAKKAAAAEGERRASTIHTRKENDKLTIILANSISCCQACC